jgi:hypothetical protein
MVIDWLLSELHYSSILRSGDLLLYPIVYRLISMTSNLSSVLNTVWGNATNSPCIDTTWTVSKVINCPKQMKVTEVIKNQFVTYFGLLMFLGDSVCPCIYILY